MASGLYLPRGTRNAQMARAIVYWHSPKLKHIILPADAVGPAPSGYQKIECKTSADVDLWSAKLRSQEKRLNEMNEQERYEFEEPIRAHMIQELEDNLKKAADPRNRMFLALSIERIKAKRQQAKQKYFESYMACEAQENVAP